MTSSGLKDHVIGTPGAAISVGTSSLNTSLTNSFDLLKSKLPNNKIICGISWSSQNIGFGNNKSINLDKLKNILLLPNIVFVDLQYGDTKKEKEKFLSKFGVEILTIKEIDNYNDILGLSNLI